MPVEEQQLLDKNVLQVEVVGMPMAISFEMLIQ
jgi:hypothetical protein